MWNLSYGSLKFDKNLSYNLVSSLLYIGIFIVIGDLEFSPKIKIT